VIFAVVLGTLANNCNYSCINHDSITGTDDDGDEVEQNKKK